MLVPVVLLAALAVAEPTPIKLAMPGLKGIRVDKDVLEFYSEHLAQQLRLVKVRVTTAREMATLIGLERQKDLLGCTDQASSCMTELAAALGVDGVVVGDLARFDSSFQLNVKVVSTRDARVLTEYSTRVEGETRLLDCMPIAAQQLARELPAALGRAPQVLAADGAPGVSVTTSASGPRHWLWAPVAGGALCGAAGAFLLAQAGTQHGQLTTPGAAHLAPDDAQRVASQGALNQTLGFTAMGVGVAALATAAGLYLWGDTAPVHPAASLGTAGWSIGVAGALP